MVINIPFYLPSPLKHRIKRFLTPQIQSHHARHEHQFQTLFTLLASLLLINILTACSPTQSTRLNPNAVYAIRDGRYDTARRELRRYSLDRNSPDVILDNLRLAVASIHDGAFFEAKMALARAYPYLVTGTVNAPNAKSTAFFTTEGHLVWKGEPFEQAAAWYYESLPPMIEGDWENTRAAAKNMLFTLVDFAGAPSVDEVMRKAESPEWFDENAKQVPSDLVIGYLILGISEYWQSRSAEADDAFNQAQKLRPDLADLITILRSGNYNTLLVVEGGEGPRKIPHGRYNEYFTFEPNPHSPPPHLMVNDENDNSFPNLPDNMAAVDFDQLAQHPRWWSLKSLRETKKAIGDILTVAGTGAVIYGSASHDANTKDKALLAGLGAIAAGQLIARGSAADLRSFDVLPRTVYLVPLNLQPGPHTIHLSIPGNHLDAVRHYIMPGYKTPAVYVTRLEPAPYYSSSEKNKNIRDRINQPITHPNDVTGPLPDSFPYILGGNDVETPTEELLDHYHQNGYLKNKSLGTLLDLYQQEGIVFAPLPANHLTTDTYHHILRGGKLLYTPVPGSKGFEDLTYGHFPSYHPHSEILKQACEIMNQQLQTNSQPQPKQPPQQ